MTINLLHGILTGWRGIALATLLPLAGCASFGQITNLHIDENPARVDYSLARAVDGQTPGGVTLVLAFSGGGTRAATLAYGVLQALRATRVRIDGETVRLLDQVDLISSVSGGSFTAAYYGLYRDGIFEEFEDKFLRRNVAGELLRGLFSPSRWFSDVGRTEMAIDLYDDTVFDDATFADLFFVDGPVIVINATDLGRGVRFSFLQEYFNLLCSDLSSFPVSRAVAASSAVPILFNPVVLRNYPDCDQATIERLREARQRLQGSPQLEDVLDGLTSYANKEDRQYIHMVDGGITDNLGLLAIYEMVEIAGGARNFMQSIGAEPAQKLVVISVNASARPQYLLESSNRVPSIENTINAMTDAQLHRTNARTLDLFKRSLARWAEDLSTPERRVEPYFVEINFDSLVQPSRRLFFHQIPVGFSLNRAQVDNLIQVGRELLNLDPEYRRFVRDMQ